MGKLSFFPWLEVQEGFECGDFRILRYRKGHHQEEQGVNQDLVDAILAPYHDTHGAPVTRATLLQHSSQESLTSDLDESYHIDLFVFADLLAFAGLARRRFFSQFEYSNRDNYGLILQEFTEPGRGVLITTRRRDGSTNTFFTGDVYKVQRPAHVQHDSVSVDQEFLAGLVSAMGHEAWPQLFQAIVLFNEANTDRSDMPVGTELILTYASLEQGLGVPGKPTRDVAEEFAAAVAPRQEVPPADWKVGQGNAHAVTLLENSTNLRTAWLQDLAVSRGSLAHGHSADAYPACWQPHEHLLLGAHALPLVIKLRLREMVGYELTANDNAGIEAFESLLNERHFEDPEDEATGTERPWNKILRDHRMRVWIRDAGERWLGQDEGAVS